MTGAEFPRHQVVAVKEYNSLAFALPGSIQSRFVPLLACEPGGEMVPSRAVADDGLNGQKQKQEDRERRRKGMNASYAEVIPGTRRQEKQC